MKKEFIPLPTIIDKNIWPSIGSPKKALAAGYECVDGVWGWWKEKAIPNNVSRAMKFIDEVAEIKKRNQENWDKYGNSSKNKDFAYTRYANALKTLQEWEAINDS